MAVQLPPSPPADDGILDDAAAWWAARHGEGWTAAQAARLDAWLTADPAHAQAYDEVARAIALFDQPSDDPLLAKFRREAAASLKPRRGVDRRWLISGGGAVAAGLAAVAVLGQQPVTATYASPARSRRSVNLPDGSRLTLDAGSEVETRFSRRARDLTLVRGQARFDVFHDAGRPFSVAVGRHVVVATGTAFNVDRLGERSTVTLLEGKVLIREGEAVIAALTPGQQFVADGGIEPRIARLQDLSSATAWQGGRLVFDNERLADAAARVNRYGQTRILLRDASLGDLRITGLFNAGDQDAFVEAITAYLPLIAERRANGDVVLSHAPRAAV